MNIVTTRLSFREVAAQDTAAIHALNSIPAVDEYNTLGIPETIAVSEKLVQEIIQAQSVVPRVRYVYVLLHNDSGEFMGLTGLVMGKPNYKNAELWYKLRPEYWNQGYATEAVNAVLTYGFKTLQLHRIEAGCATGNKGSIRVLEKTGFTKEAHTRKLLPIRGQWVDNFGFAILEEDFNAL